MIPSAYRPLCIIDSVGNILEYVVRDRIIAALGPDGFVQNQYGFYKGRNTVQALHRVKEAAELCVSDLRHT